MYRLVILSVVVAVVLGEEPNKKCGRLFHPHSMGCCKKTAEVKDKVMMSDDLKECFQAPRDPVKCEHQVCIANKRGFATDDKLDMKKFEDVVTKDMASEPEILADVKSNCINGDLSKYGPPDFCDFMKLKHCVTLQMLNNCPEWHDHPECKELMDMTAECVKSMSS